MGTRIHSVGLVVVAIGIALSISWAAPLAVVGQLLAATALIMGGTLHPLSPAEDPAFVEGYRANATGFIDAVLGQRAVTHAVAVVTPEEFFPVYGSLTFNKSVAEGKDNLDGCIRGTACTYNPVGDAPPTGSGNSLVAYGYSQSAVIASLEKRDLIAYYLAHPDQIPSDALSFVLIANPMRPNGGILERFEGLTIPLLGVTNYGAAPTNSADLGTGLSFPTVDISQQYDGWSDFPRYPLNVLATVNAVMGIAFLHPNYSSAQMDTAIEQGTVGDTTYYMIPTETLPLLIPLQLVGVPSPVIKVLDAPLRALVEMGYDRQLSPGEPVTAKWVRSGAERMADRGKLATAIRTGVDDGVQEVTGNRPFHTEPTDTYGDVKEVTDKNTPGDPNPATTKLRPKKSAAATPGGQAASAHNRKEAPAERGADRARDGAQRPRKSFQSR